MHKCCAGRVYSRAKDYAGVVLAWKGVDAVGAGGCDAGAACCALRLTPEVA